MGLSNRGSFHIIVSFCGVMLGLVAGLCGCSDSAVQKSSHSTYAWSTPVRADAAAFGSAPELGVGQNSFGDYRLVSNGTSAVMAADFCVDSSCSVSSSTYSHFVRRYEQHALSGAGWRLQGDGFWNVSSDQSSMSFVAVGMNSDASLLASFGLNVESDVNALMYANSGTEFSSEHADSMPAAIVWDTTSNRFHYGIVEASTFRPMVWSYQANGVQDALEQIFPGTASQLDLVNDGFGTTAIWQGDVPLIATQVAAGAAFTCALMQTGAIACWGANASGQLGDDSVVAKSTPVVVNGIDGTTSPKTAIAVAVGDAHACAVMLNGAVKCWGENGSGQLGDNTVVDKTTPVLVSGIDGSSGNQATAVAAGTSHSCALMTNGSIRCWGDNSFAQLGDKQVCSSPCKTPVGVEIIDGSVPEKTAVSITAGSAHTCALLDTGTVECWGRNNLGQVGMGSTSDFYTLPKDVTGLAAVSSIAAGGNRTCALYTRIVDSSSFPGALKCWGDGVATPAEVAPMDGSASTKKGTTLALGASHSCVLLATGGMKCWGANGSGQLGDSQTCGTGTCSTPQFVTGLTSSVKAMAAGGTHTCALIQAESTELKCWGANGFGQLGDVSTDSITAPALPVYQCLGNEGDCAINVASLSDGRVSTLSSAGEGTSNPEVHGFSAAADTQGNLVVAFLQKNFSGIACTSNQILSSQNCETRVYASVRGLGGQWNGPTWLDGGVGTPESSTLYQNPLQTGGIEYPSLGVTSLSNGEFLVVFPMTHSQTGVSGLYSQRLSMKSGWDPVPTTISEQTLLGVLVQYRAVNDVKLVSDGNGNALLVVHALVKDAVNVSDREYGILFYRYSATTGWSEAYNVNSLHGLPGCPASEEFCADPRPQSVLFPSGEATVLFPAPDSDLSSALLYSMDYRLQ